MNDVSARLASGPPSPVEGGGGAGPYWASDPAEVCRLLASAPEGLAEAEARQRLLRYGPNELRAQQSRSALRILKAQIDNPLLRILLVAAVVSALSGEWRDAIVVGIIVLVSVIVGYRREYSAETAVAALRARLRTQASVLRDGVLVSVPVTDVVVGDVLLLSAGTLVAADAIVLDATDCHVSESVLTGESFPVEKKPGALPPDTPLARRVNSLFLGTNVRSGVARAIVVKDGRSNRVRRDRSPLDVATAGDGVRAGDPVLRLSLDQRHAADGAGGVRRSCHTRPAADRDPAVRDRPRGRFEPGAAARHPRRESVPRRAVDGRTWRARAPAERDRESRQRRERETG